ncbi:hypothetical protein V074_02727 [Staphylococcus aureus 2010-60-1240-1]|uniref:hypothetical protein n=1 Tax=Staphylococcus aureus TaxID=1280 RepID=UPI00044CC51F|nr:hypothetical protein [Staphylococcus aureus]EZV56806.1 hypothetical protein V074_02727 [Staphylococcus aureus 2010-60-1240-1]
MENQVNITQSLESNTVSFQVKGEESFVERMTETIVKDYIGIKPKNNKYTQSYSKYDGYIGQQVNYNEEDNVPEFYKTGIKDEDGIKRYKCRYICDSCNDKGTKYINDYKNMVSCRKCGQGLKVIWHGEEYGEKQDKFNNFASAGNYVPRDLV